MTARFTTSHTACPLESLGLAKGKILFVLIPYASLWSMNVMVLVFMERLLKLFVIPRGKYKENIFYVFKNYNQTSIASMFLIINLSN